MANNSFLKDVNNKWNKWEQLLKDLFLKENIMIKDVSWEYKHYDFILNDDELQKKQISESLKQYLIKISENKEHNEDKNITIDSKNNLSSFNWKKYVFIETINNWFLLWTKSKLEKINKDKNERKKLEFIVLSNNKLLLDFKDSWIELTGGNTNNNGYIFYIPDHNISTNHIRNYVLKMLEEKDEWYYDLEVPERMKNLTEEEIQIGLNIYSYIMKNPDKLIYLVRSLWWWLKKWTNEADLIAFVSDMEKIASLVDSDSILKYIYKYHFTRIKDNVYKLKTNINMVSEKWLNIWQSAYISTEINNLTKNNFTLK